MIYIIDTSVIIEMCHRFPRDIFPTLWSNLEALAAAGEAIAPRAVLLELQRTNKADDCALLWANANPVLFVDLTQDVVDQSDYVLSQYAEDHVASQEEPWADPIIIAQGLTLANSVIITNESKKSEVKIPRICDKIGLDCENMYGLFRRKNWKF